MFASPTRFRRLVIGDAGAPVASLRKASGSRNDVAGRAEALQCQAGWKGAFDVS